MANITGGDKLLNEAKLRMALFEKGIKLMDAADHLGIDRVTFYRKLTGKSEFTLTEIRIMCDVLGISDPRPIFFDEQVSLKTQGEQHAETV